MTSDFLLSRYVNNRVQSITLIVGHGDIFP